MLLNWLRNIAARMSKATKRGGRGAARRKRRLPLALEPLETRLAPVVGAFAVPPAVPLARGYDGVVLLTSEAGSGSGALLWDARDILTAAHVVLTTEIQVVTITGIPTGGTFTLTFDGRTTAPIAYNANAAAVQAALTALPNIGANNVSVSGGPGPGTPWTITFQRKKGQTDLPQMGANGAALTGGVAPAVTVTTQRDGGDTANNLRVRFEMPDADGSIIPIDFDVPQANIVRHSGFNPAKLDDGNDIALVHLPALAPFRADRYNIYRQFNDNAGGVNFTFSGYGNTGTGATGQTLPPTTGQPAGVTDPVKRSGNSTFTGDFGAVFLGRAKGLLAAFPNPGPGGNNAAVAQGDSGGPAWIGNDIAGINAFIQNTNGSTLPPPAPAGTPLYSDFGDTSGFTRVSYYADWIDSNIENPYDLVLDMNKQALGVRGDVHDLTITASRNGNLIELSVARTQGSAVVPNPYYLGTYWVEASSNLRSLTIRGSADNETIRIVGPLDLDTINIDGGGGNNKVILDYSGADAAPYTVTATNVTRGTGVINYARVSSLALTTGPQADTISIQGTATGVDTSVNAGRGNDTIRIGNVNNRLDGIHVTVNGGAGTDSLTITNEGWNGAETHTITDTTYTINPPHGLIATYGGMESFELRCGSGNDTVNVRATDRNTRYSIFTGVGTNTANVGWDNTMAFIRGGVALFGGGTGTDRVFFNNQANTSRANYTLSSSTLFLTVYTLNIGGLGPIVYRNFSYVEVNADDVASGDTIAIEATDLAATTQVNAGGGADDIFITNKLNRLDGIRVSINGQAGDDTLTISNVGWSGGDTYTITATTFSILPPNGLIATFVSVENLALNTGGGRDIVNITNTPTGTTTVKTGSGNDDVVVTGASGRLDLSGQAGDDRFVFRNFTRTANVYGGPGDDTIESAAGPLAASQITFETVETLLISGGSTLTFDTDVSTDKVIVQNGTADVRNRTLNLRNGAANGVQVQQQGILSGTGTIRGTVSNAGQVRPAGDGAVGQFLIRGDYVQTARVNYDLQGPAAGTQSDNLYVTGKVQLVGTLSVNALAGFNGNLFELITNRGGGVINGTFAGLAEGANVVVGGRQFQISYKGGTGNDVVLRQVAKVGSATTVSSSLNPSVYGQSVTFTATVMAVTPGSGTPTGLVQFQVDGVNLGAPVPLFPTGTVTTSSLTTLTVGSHVITASYSGDGTFLASTGTGTQIVTPAPLTITANNQSKVYGAPLPALTASYSGFVNGDTPANLTTLPTLTTTATAGSHVSGNPYAITASGAAAANYTISYVAGTLTVTPAPLTITADNQSKVYGAALPALTASYSGLVNGDTPASLTTAPTLTTTATASSSVGSYPITASGAVDADYTISYVAGSLTVNPAGTVTAVAANNPTSVFGEPIVFTATVASLAPGAGTPTGSVAFKRLSPDGTIVVTFGTAALDASGTAVIVMDQFVPATATVFAVYLGDGNFATSTSTTLTHVITKANTTLALSSSTPASVVGQPVNFTSILGVVPPGSFVAAPTGTITYYDTFQGSTTVLATSSVGGPAQSPAFTAAGTHLISAVYSGDSNFNGSTSTSLTQVVNKAATHIGLSVTPNPIVYGQTLGFTFSFGVDPPGSGSPTGTATVTDTFQGVTRVLFSTTVGVGGGGSFAPLPVGTHILAITYQGDNNFLGSTSLPYTLVVNPASTTTTLTSSTPMIAYGQPLTLSINVAVMQPGGGTPTGTVTVYDTYNGSTTVLTSGPLGGALPSFAPLAVGTHVLQVVYSGDANFLGSLSDPFIQVVTL